MKKIKYLVIIFVICFLSIAFVMLDSVFSFTSPKVINTSIQNETYSIEIQFDKPVKRQEIQASIYPQVHGQWEFRDPIIKNHLYKSMVFIPAVDLDSGIQYQVKLDNIKGFGSQTSNSFEFTFETEVLTNRQIELASAIEPSITIIDIPLDWQDDSLSCEAASLKMALAGKDVFVTENEIMEHIGYDLTPHRGNIWGNPYEKYVGDIDGKMCRTGFGVYWQPVADAANNWRESEAFSGWDIKDLTKELRNGNPVVFWGVMPTGTLTNCSWWTPEGEYVKAYWETHVRLIIGFIGPKDNPSKIIINDPLAGRIYWSTSYFLQNWAAYDYSGVVVR